MPRLWCASRTVRCVDEGAAARPAGGRQTAQGTANGARGTQQVWCGAALAADLVLRGLVWPCVCCAARGAWEEGQGGHVLISVLISVLHDACLSVLVCACVCRAGHGDWPCCCMPCHAHRAAALPTQASIPHRPPTPPFHVISSSQPYLCLCQLISAHLLIVIIKQSIDGSIIAILGPERQARRDGWPPIAIQSTRMHR